MHDEAFPFLRQVCGEANRARAAVPAKRSLDTLLSELLSKKWLASCVGCVGETNDCK